MLTSISSSVASSSLLSASPASQGPRKINRNVVKTTNVDFDDKHDKTITTNNDNNYKYVVDYNDKSRYGPGIVWLTVAGLALLYQVIIIIHQKNDFTMNND